jgi:MmyB-like transcription regulator ligand binding domain
LLARPRAAATASSEVRPGIHALLDRLDPQPAYVTGPWLDVLAWNPAGADLLLGIDRRKDGDRNLARLVFPDPTTAASWAATARRPRASWAPCARP